MQDLPNWFISLLRLQFFKQTVQTCLAVVEAKEMLPQHSSFLVWRKIGIIGHGFPFAHVAIKASLVITAPQSLKWLKMLSLFRSVPSTLKTNMEASQLAQQPTAAQTSEWTSKALVVHVFLHLLQVFATGTAQVQAFTSHTAAPVLEAAPKGWNHRATPRPKYSIPFHETTKALPFCSLKASKKGSGFVSLQFEQLGFRRPSWSFLSLSVYGHFCEFNLSTSTCPNYWRLLFMVIWQFSSSHTFAKHLLIIVRHGNSSDVSVAVYHLGL